MAIGSINFGTSVSTDLPRFTPNINQIARAAVLHYVDDQNNLQPIIRAGATHYHQVPDGQQGLGGFLCHSTGESLAVCCKHTDIFQEPLVKLAIPIILYATTFQGDLIPGAMPEIQLMIIYNTSWTKLNQINKSYPLATNDFTIAGKKQGKGTSLDFMPAGPAFWQQDNALFSQFLSKAKVLVEGPGLTGIDRILGRKVTLMEIENSIRAASGLGPVIPAPPMVPPVPLMPMGNVGNYTASPAPAPQVNMPVPPIPPVAPVSLPTAAAPGTGPASAAQISAIASMLAPSIPTQVVPGE